MAEPTAFEQLFLELINRARLDPAAEAARTGVSLGTISPTQKQPLAFNSKINDAADNHTAWMLANDSFSHYGPGGNSPGQRMSAAGYGPLYNWGENIAYNGTSGTPNITSAVMSQHDGLFRSSGHRANILNNSFKEAGIGVGTGDYRGFNAVMTTQDFGTSSSGSFVTGVAYTDTNNNAFYSVGEGKGGIQVQLLSGASVLGSTATWGSGGFSLKTTATGDLTVKFSGGGLAQTVGAIVAMGASTNTKVDLVNGHTVQSSVSAELIGTAGNLKLIGSNDTDAIGNAGANSLSGNRGNNLLEGLGGNDTLRGGSGTDLLDGGSGDDTILGHSGNDYLQGLTGNDRLAGGADADTFVFMNNYGNDRITDFQDGIDRIRFLQAAGDDFGDLSITGNGTASVTVAYDGGTIVVAGPSAITLTASDFEFLA